jgi:adenine-specific DNA-methyltransferase
LIASPYFSRFQDTQFIGIENKVNYIYRPKGDLEQNEVIGISAVLNSKLFDSYFRIFNGNVNVSASELREMPLPPLEIIKQVGDQLINIGTDFSQVHIDDIVNKMLFINKEPAQ